MNLQQKTEPKITKKKTEVIRLNSNNNIDIDGQHLNEVDKYTLPGR